MGTFFPVFIIAQSPFPILHSPVCPDTDYDSVSWHRLWLSVLTQIMTQCPGTDYDSVSWHRLWLSVLTQIMTQCPDTDYDSVSWHRLWLSVLTQIMTQCPDTHMLRFLCPYFHFSQFSASTQFMATVPTCLFTAQCFDWTTVLTCFCLFTAQCIDTDRGINCPDTPFHSPLPRHKLWQLSWYTSTLSQSTASTQIVALTVLIHFYPFTVHCLDTNYGNCPDTLLPFHSPVFRHILWQLSWRVSTRSQSSASATIT